MLLLNEITFEDDGRKRENRILINPYLITTVRQPGIYTLLTTVDGQEIKLSDTIFHIKDLLTTYDLSLLDSEVINNLKK